MWRNRRHPLAYTSTMNKITLCALTLLLCSTMASAGDDNRGVSITFDSKDPHVHLGPRHEGHDARIVITTHDGSTSLLLMKDVVAVQLTDHALAKIKPKDDDNFLEELVVSGVQVALRKAVEYPIANIRTVEVRDGVLTIVNDQNQTIFKEIKVNGTEVLHDFSTADAARFVSAFKAVRGGGR